MKKVIFDCDNTLGLKKKEVDDGLAFLFLLGRKDIDLMGISSVFGNSSLNRTFEVTEKMLQDFSLKGRIPHLKGAEGPGDFDTEAADFMAEKAAENKGEITIIAAGALTNLYTAWKKDSNFFKNVKEIIVMGGTTDPLNISSEIIPELNLSCDPEAAEKVLQADVPVALMTGNLCLAARFGEKSWHRVGRSQNKPVRAYIKDKISDWYQYSSEIIGLSGFYMWDVVPAVYMIAPELFLYNKCKLVSTAEDLKNGRIKTEKTDGKLADAAVINLPSTIIDTKRFKDIIFAAWDNIEIVPEGY
ncbi:MULTISPECIES: nucleoside hydrolase [unclassified Halanaerobium]|uniref:nucleoside hydrolase n=1 Tax=unclassified Halanaerobium TaxID=2641197 RepID=UPI000DF4540D|nr:MULTISPECIES: nucleoside hydrolase [unclassified Halanaerobium]RCW49917.1 inosine-uridine nucleoside N-ribohydrolase [Halanaerobium sp. MA284_MarDTE_T2]RCW88560.1 inosine-uridine nucleoside N-ribohydrolase [Halanaerobium sp. DL-01]